MYVDMSVLEEKIASLSRPKERTLRVQLVYIGRL